MIGHLGRHLTRNNDELLSGRVRMPWHEASGGADAPTRWLWTQSTANRSPQAVSSFASGTGNFLEIRSETGGYLPRCRGSGANLQATWRR